MFDRKRREVDAERAAVRQETETIRGKLRETHAKLEVILARLRAKAITAETQPAPVRLVKP